MVEPLVCLRPSHNSTACIHTIAEAIKLAFADREHYYGDPRFVDVPMEELLSEDYLALRRELIRPGEAWPDLPAPGGSPAALPPSDPREGRNCRAGGGSVPHA